MIKNPFHSEANFVVTLQAALIALAVAGYPLVASVSTALGINGTIISISMRSLVVLASTILILRLFRNFNPKHVIYLSVFSIFWVLYLARLVVDTVLRNEMLFWAPIDYWIWAVGVCLIPSLGLIGVAAEPVARTALTMTWIALGIASVLTVPFGTTLVLGSSGTENDTGRLALESLNPISVGHLGASLAILSGWKMRKASRPGFISLLLSGLGIFVGLYLVISAASRGPILALLCVIAACAMNLTIRRLITIFLILVFSVTSLASVILTYIDFETLSLIERIAGSTSGEDQSVNERQEGFSGAWSQFLQHPLIGDFLDVRSTGSYPHNLILEAFMSTGIVGGASLVLIIGVAMWKSYVMVRDSRSYAWIGLLYIQYCIGAQVSGSLYTSNVFWVFSALVIFMKANSKCFKSEFSARNTKLPAGQKTIEYAN